MRIETLKDLKKVLEKIPEEDLELFGIGIDVEGGDGEVSLLVIGEENMKLFDKHKQSTDVLNNYFDNICDWSVEAYEQTTIDKYEELDDGLITSETKVKKVKKKE